MPLILFSLGETSKSYSFYSPFSLIPQVKNPRGEKYVVFHGSCPTLAMDGTSFWLAMQS